MKILLLSSLLLAAAADSTFEDKLRGWVGSQSWLQGAAYCDGDLSWTCHGGRIRATSPRNRCPGSRRIARRWLAATETMRTPAGGGTRRSRSTRSRRSACCRSCRRRGSCGNCRRPAAVPHASRSRTESSGGPRGRSSRAPRRGSWTSRRRRLSCSLRSGVWRAPRWKSNWWHRARGVSQQPLLLKAKALPVHVFNAYHFLSTWRFEPAKVDGEPVDSIDTPTIFLHSSG